jgi:hypothetical protein
MQAGSLHHNRDGDRSFAAIDSFRRWVVAAFLVLSLHSEMQYCNRVLAFVENVAGRVARSLERDEAGG